MSACDECSGRILSYLDDRLQSQELADFRAHLERCSNCRANVEAERSLSQLLRRTRPLYSTPPALYARVAVAVDQYAAPARASRGFYERVFRRLESAWGDPARHVARLRLLAAALAVTAMFFAFVPNFVRQVRAANYVDAAVANHRSYLNGQLPLELQSSSPEQVTAWFTGKVPFAFRLPRARVTPDSQPPPYQLTGASLVNYHGKRAAFVAYQKQNEKISLLVASSDSAVVAGGDEVRSSNLIFHYRSDQGFNVVTWSSHGFSYALVSSVSSSARDSCMVCHQSMADHRNFSSTR